jgi:hypothetical protein
MIQPNKKNKRKTTYTSSIGWRKERSKRTGGQGNAGAVGHTPCGRPGGLAAACWSGRRSRRENELGFTASPRFPLFIAAQVNLDCRIRSNGHQIGSDRAAARAWAGLAAQAQVTAWVRPPHPPFSWAASPVAGRAFPFSWLGQPARLRGWAASTAGPKWPAKTIFFSSEFFLFSGIKKKRN